MIILEKGNWRVNTLSYTLFADGNASSIWMWKDDLSNVTTWLMDGHFYITSNVKWQVWHWKPKVRLHIVDLRCRYFRGGMKSLFELKVCDVHGMYNVLTNQGEKPFLITSNKIAVSINTSRCIVKSASCLSKLLKWKTISQRNANWMHLQEYLLAIPSVISS